MSPSNFAIGNSIGAEPDARMTFSPRDFDLAIDGCELDLLAGQQLAVTDEPFDLGCLEQAGDATGQLSDDTSATLLHRGDIDATSPV